MIEFNCEQGSPEWFDLRAKIPTASNFSRIITTKGKRSASQELYIAELIAESVYPTNPEDRPTSRAMEHGTQTEAEARRWYEMEHGDVRQVGFCLADDKSFGCSPDGLCDPDGVLEVKCPGAKAHVTYKMKGTLPNEYKAQCHGELAVTGRKWLDFLSYCPGFEPFLIRVEPDDFTKALIAELREFWIRYQLALRKLKGDQ